MPTSRHAHVSAPGSAGDWRILRDVFSEYVATLGFPLSFQDFEREIADAHLVYAPPSGGAWIGRVGGEVAGAVGLRRFDGASAELKRMYVRPAFRRLGIGRMLAEAAIDAARRIGYGRILLDSSAEMKPAIALYESLGFVTVEPYRHNPLEDAVFLQLRLTSG